MRAAILSLAAAASLAPAAPAQAAPTWLAPHTFETGRPNPPQADVAVAPNGTAIAVWVVRVSGQDVMRTSVRLPGQGFGPVSTLTPPGGGNATSPDVAVDAGGQATLAWEQEQGPGGVHAIRTSTVAAGAQTPGDSHPVSDTTQPSTGPVVAVGASGSALIAYREGAFGNRKVRAVARDGAAGDFGSPVDVSGTDVTDLPVAGVDDGGEAVVAWPRNIGSNTIIEANTRPPGGSFALAGVEDISKSILNAAFPALAIAPDGTTLVLWSQTNTSDVRYNERTPAGAWLMDAKIASPGDVTATAPSVAMDGAGNAIAVWSATRGTSIFLQAGLRPAGGAFGSDNSDLTSTSTFSQVVRMNRAGDAVITFSNDMATAIGSVRRPRGGAFSGVIPADTRPVESTSLYNAGLGVDDEGNATGVWTRNVDPAGANTYDVAGGSFDAAPPTLAAVSVPAGATVGAGVGMAAAATDRLTPVSLAWSFGDGAGAEGGAVSHAFGAPGAFNVTVTARDAVGNAASATRPILISPFQPPPPPPATPRIQSPVLVLWGVDKRKIYLLRMKVTKVPRGGKAELRCRGRRCPFRRFASTKRRKRAITLFREIKPTKVIGKRRRSFRAGQRLQLRITAPGYIGKVVKYRLRKGRIPSGRQFCLPLGSTTPRRTC